MRTGDNVSDQTGNTNDPRTTEFWAVRGAAEGKRWAQSDFENSGNVWQDDEDRSWYVDASSVTRVMGDADPVGDVATEYAIDAWQLPHKLRTVFEGAMSEAWYQEIEQRTGTSRKEWRDGERERRDAAVRRRQAEAEEVAAIHAKSLAERPPVTPDTLVVVVRRQWNDYRQATYRLEDFSGARWDTVSGGVQATATQPFIHGYVWCDAMIDGSLGHSCQHGAGPHHIKVCVVKKDNAAAVYAKLLEVAGPKPVKQKARSYDDR